MTGTYVFTILLSPIYLPDLYKYLPMYLHCPELKSGMPFKFGYIFASTMQNVHIYFFRLKETLQIPGNAPNPPLFLPPPIFIFSSH